MRMNQRWTASFAAVTHGFLTNGVARQRIGAVAFGNVQPGKSLHQFRYASAGRLYLYRNGNGIAVVFHQIKQRQFLGTCRVQRFPEFTFARRSVAGRNINNFIRCVLRKLAQRRFLRLCQRLGMRIVIKGRLGCAHRVHELRPGAR